MASAVAAIFNFVKVGLSLFGVGSVVKLGLAIAVQVVTARKAKKVPKRGPRGLTLTISESDYPRRIIYGKSRVGGIRLYLETTDSQFFGLSKKNRFLNMVLGLGEGPIESIDKMYFGEQEIPLVQVDGNTFHGDDPTDANGRPRYMPDPDAEDAISKFRNVVRVKFYLGSDDQPADADLVEHSTGNWTTAHRLKGTAYVFVSLYYDPEIFDTGLPEISFEVTGRNDIYDPRTDSTGYSNNAALCWSHYMRIPHLGPEAGESMIDQPALITAANICDESIPLASGGTEPRYTVNGVISMEDHPRDILADFQAAMAGWRTFAGGKFQIFAGHYETPTFEITEDMIVSAVNLSSRMPKRERANIVKAVYYASEHKWQFTDAPVREKQSYIDEDGEELPKSLELALVHKGTQAQRLANIDLERGRFQKTVQLTCNLRAFPAVAGHTVMLTFSRYGWNRKVFLVENSQPIFAENGDCLVELSLREVSPTVYDWTADDELPVTTPAPIGNGKPEIAGATANPAGGIFLTTDFPLNVTLTSISTGATLRWSKATVPASQTSGSAYTGAITVYQNETIFARAFDGEDTSSVLIASYIVEQVERVTATPAGGTFGSFPVDVTLATATSGATIRWSKSAVPTTVSDGTAYSSPVSVSAGETLHARAFKTGLLDSDSISETYTS